MPFQSVQFPSLGLGSLKASLAREGIESQVRYASLDHARTVGFDLYQLVAVTFPTVLSMVGDWIFSAALFDEDPDPDLRLLDAVRRADPEVVGLADEDREAFCAGIARARREAPAFLDALLDDLDLDGVDVVGFTDVYMQRTASLALARRIRARSPRIPLIFGGPGCEDVMGRELIRRFPFVDAAVDGEGERVLPRLVRRLVAGRDPGALPGVITGDQVETHGVAPRPVEEPPADLSPLDALPTPDYGDYFDQRARADVPPEYPAVLMFETSRGCWWNLRSRCAFCGLNGRYLQFRSKSVERSLAQLRSLLERHGRHGIALADNNQQPAFLRELGAGLRTLAPEVPVYLGIRPTLGDQALRDMGGLEATRFIVGVESLSSDALRFVGKGTTAARNVRFLRTARELGLRVEWNLLWGFPGEDESAYDRLLPRIPLLSHLTPPFRAVPVQLHRFSPMAEGAEELGLAPLRAAPAYDHVYPFDGETLRNLAYYFRFPADHEARAAALGDRLRPAVGRWHRDHAGAALLWFGGGGAGDQVIDRRPAARREVTPLSAEEAALLAHCRRERTAATLVDGLADGSAPGPWERAREAMLAAGFLVELDGQVLSLPLDLRAGAADRDA